MAVKNRYVEKSVEIRMKLRPDFPLDLPVRTPETIRRRLAVKDGFIRDIPQNGKALYETHRV